MDAADGLGQDHADVHRLDLGTLQLLDLMRYGVGHNHLPNTGNRSHTQQDMQKYSKCCRHSFLCAKQRALFLLFKASHTLFLYLTARPPNRFPRKARQEHEYVSKLHHQLQKLTNSFRCKDACTLHPLHTVSNTPLQQVLQLH